MRMRCDAKEREAKQGDASELVVSVSLAPPLNVAGWSGLGGVVISLVVSLSSDRLDRTGQSKHGWCFASVD